MDRENSLSVADLSRTELGVREQPCLSGAWDPSFQQKLRRTPADYCILIRELCLGILFEHAERFVLQLLFGRFALSQLRAVAKAYRFVIPGHILTSLLSLGIRASDRWRKSAEDLSLKDEARAFEILLPLVACAFIYASIPKQMKNYFVAGALFLGIGIVRLQQDVFQDQARWSITLLLLGSIVMFAATRYSFIKMRLARLLRRSL